MMRERSCRTLLGVLLMMTSLLLPPCAARARNMGGDKVAVRQVGDDWSVLIVTPIMQRAQKDNSAKETIFVDSSSSCDTSQSNVTILSTATKAGAIPLAVLIHKHQTQSNYEQAFSLLRDECPNSFCGNEYPSQIMTDDSAAERNALKIVWPQSKLLLCHFHVAQAEWKWLFSNAVKEQRVRLMKKFQKVMYAREVDELNTAIKLLEREKKNNTKYVERFHKFMTRRSEWLLIDRLYLITRNHNTNNFSEASIRVLKDIVLQRTRAYNVVALVEFTVTVWENYFCHRLLDFAHNRRSAPRIFYEKLCKKMTNCRIDEIKSLDENLYEVPSSKKDGRKYVINSDVGTCTCPQGSTGAFCKHQAFIHKSLNLKLPNCPPVNQQERYSLAKLALGEKCPPSTFFLGLEETISAEKSNISTSNTEKVSSIGENSSKVTELLPCSRTESIEQPRYDTAYACEGSTLSIECKEGEIIHLIRANYGRFSITICNDNGNTEWSVNCMSPRSLRVLHSRCSLQQNCSILASTSLFGEPCPGTRKYLEAHYQCLPAATTTTTSRPSPPWLITSQPSVWSTAKLPSLRPVQKVPAGGGGSPELTTLPSPVLSPSTTTPSPPQHTGGKVVPGQSQQPPPPISAGGNEDDEDEFTFPPPESTTLPPSTTAVPIWKTTRRTTAPSTSVFEYKPSPSVSWMENDLAQFCAPATARNLNWNWTQLGEMATQACPGGATGQARWRCGLSEATSSQGVSRATWQPATPDLSECRSVWLTSLESRIKEGDSIISIADDLSQVTSSKMLYGGDMMTTTKIIKKMAQKISVDIQTFPDPRQREAIVTELLHKVVLTSSNLLDISQHPSWRDLSYAEQMRVATSLLIGLEENAFLLADTVIVEKTVVEKVKNILLSVRVVETRNIGVEEFPSAAVWEQWTASRDWLQLPRGALLENSEGGLVRLVFVAFDRLEEILQPQVAHTTDDDGATIVAIGENGEVSGPPIKSQRNHTRVLNSKVISASLGKGRHIQLSEPVRLCLRHIRTENVSNPSCVFWDYTMSAWSEEGCEVEASNRTHTVCKCDHLTNFAVLMDVHATTLKAHVHQTALQIITYVGCIISIVCLILAIITFQLFRGLKSDRTTIHKNLCFCLLVAEVLFLAGIGQTDKRVICGVVAGFLHFFFLCAFAWMFLEGFQLYVMLIEVFEAEKPRIRWYYIFAYGAPLIIVAVSCVVDPNSYGTDKYCWLRADNFFIFSFVGPVILVILANLVFLSMAIYKMCRHTSTSVPVKSKEHARLASASGKEENAHSNKIQSNLAWLRGAIVLVFLLGLTWTFGLLYLNEESVIMAYIFTVLNSLQGLFIFIFHCVQNEKVHKEYRKFIRRNSWLPKCLRCSKPSTGKEQSSSFYAGSNGNPSAPNSHSTDSSALSPHGTSYILQRGWSGRTSSRAKPSLALSRASQRACSRAPPTSNPSDQEVEKISFKSYSRDSGHGGSEQEDSPRSHNTTTLSSLNNLRCLNNSKDTRRQSFMPPDYHQGITNDLSTTAEGQRIVLDGECGLELCRGEEGSNTLSRVQQQQQQQAAAMSQQEMHQLAPPAHMLPQLLHHQLAAHHHYLTQQLPHGRVPKKINAGLLRSASPWNHTYTEIRDGHLHPSLVHLRPPSEDDPVYEEIERSEIQVSDMSDEDVKRQSDMSRQSSRSYSDHRPLIPYSPGAERNVQNCLDSLVRQKLREHRYQAASPGGATASALGIHGEDDGDAPCMSPHAAAAAAAAEARYRCQQLNSPRHNAKPHPYLYPSDNVRTVAFLEGETVVCHLQPEHELYAHNPYSTRTMVLSPYSEC